MKPTYGIMTTSSVCQKRSKLFIFCLTLSENEDAFKNLIGITFEYRFIIQLGGATFGTDEKEKNKSKMG
jgi:hypothetical protein